MLITNFPKSKARWKPNKEHLSGGLLGKVITSQRTQYTFPKKPDMLTYFKPPKGADPECAVTDAFVSYLLNHTGGSACPAVGWEDFLRESHKTATREDSRS